MVEDDETGSARGEGYAQSIGSEPGYYHKGVGEEDKTSGGRARANEKGPAKTRGPRKRHRDGGVHTFSSDWADSALLQFLATSGFGAS